MFNLYQRFEQGAKYRFVTTAHASFDEAVWVAREINSDYVIEKAPCGIAPAEVLKYRLGKFESA